MAYRIAFLRPFAAPHLAEIMHRTGKMAHAPERRAGNTGIVIHEILFHGFDHPRSIAAIDHMARMHNDLGISNDDMLYILHALMGAVDTVDALGWRHLTDAERQSGYAWTRALGEHMGITDIAESLDAARDHIQDYDRRHGGCTPATRRFGQLIVNMLKQRLPTPWNRVAGQLFRALTDEGVADALALPRSRFVSWLIKLGIALRRSMRAKRADPIEARWRPGQPTISYHAGYTLEDVIHKK